MEVKEKRIEEEIADLQEEIKMFEHEKERVRTIVGKIGGVPTFSIKFLNIAFAILVLVCLVVSIVSGGTLRLIMIEAAIAVVSAKLIFLIHHQARMAHLQLWILSSLEWRLNELIKKMEK